MNRLTPSKPHMKITIEILGFSYTALLKLGRYDTGNVALELIEADTGRSLSTLTVKAPHGSRLNPGEFYAYPGLTVSALLTQLEKQCVVERLRDAPPAETGFIQDLKLYRIQPALLDVHGNILPECFCPTCNTHLDAATDVSLGPRRGPKPGELCICTTCGELLAYNADMTIRLASLDDLLTYSERDREMIGRAQAMVRRARPLIFCALCQKPAAIRTAHWHQGRYIGACCWDERLRMTE